MTLLDDIKAERIKKGPTCSVAGLLQTLDKQDSKDLADALEDITITATAIVKVLGVRGHRITAEALRRHRRRVCDCGTR